MLFRKIQTLIESHLLSNPDKILLIDGARQVGKTFIIRHIGRKLFETLLKSIWWKTLSMTAFFRV